MTPKGGNSMKKISVRKAGPIRLTTACYYLCGDAA
jgi:hypothetical protein